MKKKIHCEVKNCKEKVWCTAYPDDLNMKLCLSHAKERLGGLFANTEIVDLTET